MSGYAKDAILVRELVEYAGVTVTEVARKAKVDPETLHKPLNGRADTRLSQRTLEKLQVAYPGYPGWTQKLESPRSAFRHQPAEQAPSDDLVEINEIDLRYGMGASDVSGPVEVSSRSFSREWLRSFTDARPADLVWTLGRGDSMHPTIRDGEPILINLADRTLTADDCVWACTVGDFGMIKRLRPTSEGVTIMSDNTLVSDDFAADDELRIIGRVIAKVGRL